MKSSLTVDVSRQKQFPFNTADDLSSVSESDLRELVFNLRQKLGRREAVIEEQ